MTLEEIGRQLREARERKGLTLHDVQVATKIRRKYLEALERGDDAELPPEVYTRGFIRAYASLVDLDGMELARAYSRWKQARGTAGGQEGEAGGPAPAWMAGSPGEGAQVPDRPADPAEEPGDPSGRIQERGEEGRRSPGAVDTGGRRRPPLPPAAPSRRPVADPPEAWAPPPLVTPGPRRKAAAGGRGRGRGTGPRALATASRAPRPWGRWLAGLAALAAVVAVVLYMAGAPDTPGGPRPPASPGQPGQAPDGQAAAPGGDGGGAAAPGGGGAGPQTPVEPPASQPPAPQVMVRRDGNDVYFAIRLAEPGGGAPPPGGAGSPGAEPAGERPQVTLTALDRVWVRVRDAGGQVVFEQLMQAGQRHAVPLGEGLVIRVGYPRGLALHLGDTELDVPDEQSPLNLHLEPAP